MITIHLAPQLEAKLVAFAAACGKNEDVIAGQAITDFLEEMEEAALAEARLNEQNPRVSFEDMRSRVFGDAL